MRKLFYIVAICLTTVAVLSGCSAAKRLGFGDKDSEQVQPVSSIAMSEAEAQALMDKVPIHLYFANSDNTKLKLEVRYISATEAKKSVNHLAGIIVDELIKGPTDKSLKPTIPAGTKQVSPVTINGTVATVDLSKDFVDKHSGGKDLEKLTIYSIVNSLTEIKEIDKVQFKIEGKVQSRYKGNYKFDVPFPRSTTVISMETTSAIGNDNAKEVVKQGSESKVSASDGKQTAGNTSARTSTFTTAGSQNSTMENAAEQSLGEIPGEDSEATYIETLEEAEAGEVLE